MYFKVKSLERPTIGIRLPIRLYILYTKGTTKKRDILFYKTNLNSSEKSRRAPDLLFPDSIRHIIIS